MDNRKATGWIALGVGAAAAILVTRELAGTKERRERLVEKLHQGVGSARRAGEVLIDDGEDYVSKLRSEVRSLRSEVADGIRPEQEKRQADLVRNHESAIVAFMASVVIKGVSSYMQWRSLEKARDRSGRESGSGDQGTGGSRDPADLTLAELRRAASLRNVEGRSGMNKQELVSALQE